MMGRALLGALAVALAVGAGAAVPAPTPVQQAQAGPWGLIEYRYLYIEATEELMVHLIMPEPSTRWFFPVTESELREFFLRAGMSSPWVARVMDPQRMVQRAGSITLFPADEDLEDIAPEKRAIIYAQLARWPENEYCREPVFFIGGVEPWLRDARLDEDLKQKIRRMAYPRGRVTAFSDVHALLVGASSDHEVRRIMKVMTRTRTLLAEVKVTPQTDFNQLYEYWSDQRRSREIRPFLESIAERPAAAAMDLIHLLPRSARRFLYSYPTIDLAAEGSLPDCHWSSLNFFHTVPRSYYLDSRLATAHVLANYVTVPPPYAFGDVLFFLNAAGDAIHSCVHLADDIVYTKNGSNILAPWILMRRNDLDDLYGNQPGTRVQGYRRQPPNP